MIYIFICRRCDDLPVAVCCWVMGVSTSGFYGWRADPVTQRDWDDAQLTNKIFDIHEASRRSYGSPRVHAELVLGEGIRVSRKRVERLMAEAGIVGIHKRRNKGCTHRDDNAEPSQDLVKRRFEADGPDRLWVMDVTEHPTATGKIYLAVVVDVWSRLVVGWSIATHIRAELVAMRCRWRSGDAGQPRVAPWPIPITAPSTRPGRSANDYGRRGCWVRWDRSAMPSTTPQLKASSPRCSASCSTSTTGMTVTSSPTRSSNGSKPGTTRAADTHRLKCAAPPTSKLNTSSPPRSRHDHIDHHHTVA